MTEPLGGAQPVLPQRRVPRPEPVETEAQMRERIRAEVQAEYEGNIRAAAAEAVDSRSGVSLGAGPQDNSAPWYQQAAQPPPFVNPAPDLSGKPSTNRYAPTTWGGHKREEFDYQTPSGQWCRLRRLERDDVIDLGLMQYLDTFLPLLMDNTMSDDEKAYRANELVKQDPEAMNKMFAAVDQVVISSCMRPKVTAVESEVYEGTPQDWANPMFVATISIRSINIMDRMAIFNAAFGRSMEELKSVQPGQTPGVDDVANVAGVQPSA